MRLCNVQSYYSTVYKYSMYVKQQYLQVLNPPYIITGRQNNSVVRDTTTLRHYDTATPPATGSSSRATGQCMDFNVFA